MTLEQQIENIITSTLLEKGFRIVRIQFQGSKRKTLQVMIERMDAQNVSVDDCAFISRNISMLLEVEDPIHEPYILEVSSPGLDRPLVQKNDFQRFSGAMIRLELKTAYEGSRRFRGLLLGLENDCVKIELDPEKKIVNFAFSDIQKAKLIPDYELSK